MNFIRRWFLSTIVLGCFLWFVNKYHYFPRGCDDCGIYWGFPFHFQRTETFATAPRVLWSGLIADSALVLIAALIAALVWSVASCGSE